MKTAICCVLAFSGVLRADLTKEEATKVIAETYKDLASKRELKMKEVKDGFRYFEIKAAGKTMRCVGKQYGEAEAGKRALYISMHGGGGAPARVNDQQWNNQIQLYVPKEGWYVAPRAPTDTWNLWHEGHIDELFSKLIEDMVALKGVDPSRVYLMGYSAGGDGVYQLAPRLADRFGAATMMAGHPNGVSADGLYNLPFRIYMGGKDAAYKRNEIADQWKGKLAKLQKERGGYEHKVTIYPEMGHWMNKKDAEAVPWMATKTRKAWPKKVIWGKTGKRSERFYWLGGKPKGVVIASVKGQEISVEGAGDVPLTLFLNDELLNLDEPVKVIVDGKEVHSGKVERNRGIVWYSLVNRLDPSMAACAALTVNHEKTWTGPIFKIAGRVKNEGHYVWKKEMTLTDAIALGGGYSEGAVFVDLMRAGEKYTYDVHREDHLKLKVYAGDEIELRVPVSPEAQE